MSSLSLLSLVTVLITASSSVFLAQCTNDQACRTLITFNAGLTPSIGHYPDRRLEIPNELLVEDADVVCLQEYWFERDIQHLVSSVETTYPHHFSQIHAQVGSLADPSVPEEERNSPCSFDDTHYLQGVILSCGVRYGCGVTSGASTEETLACVANCLRHLPGPSINPHCFQCVVNSAPNMTNLFEWCQPRASGEDNRLNAPGLVLLSKHPISHAQYHSFEPDKHMTIQRGYVQAEIEGVGLVVCTHMSAGFGSYFEYDLPYSSYAEQQSHEIETLTANFGSRDHILAGDLNMGPRIIRDDLERKLDGEMPCSFQALMNAGYQSSYVQDDGRCTYCEHSNQFCDGYNTAIDFALFKGDQYSYRFAERVLDQTSPHPLSDHYGIKTTMCR